MQVQYEIISERLDRIEQALLIKNKEQKYIDLDELCNILGIAKRTYYQNQSHYNFNKYKFGRKLRFVRAEIVAWMNSHIIPATS